MPYVETVSPCGLNVIVLVFPFQIFFKNDGCFYSVFLGMTRQFVHIYCMCCTSCKARTKRGGGGFALPGNPPNVLNEQRFWAYFGGAHDRSGKNAKCQQIVTESNLAQIQ